MKMNDCRLVPGKVVYWGDIVGNIEDQTDLQEIVEGYVTEDELEGKQDKLVSGENIKTINNISLLGSGNIDIQGGGGGGQENVIEVVKVNGTALPVDENKAVDVTVPTAVGQLSNDAGYITTSALSGYATESWVSGQGYLTSVPAGYATEQWVSEQGYLTSVPAGYATQSWVSAQGYLTSVPAGYATEQWTEQWVESQGYVSDPNNDLYPLFNKEEGYLRYNLIAPGYSETWIGGGNFPTTYGARTVFNLNGTVFNYALLNGDGNIYYFNTGEGKFEKIATANGDIPGTQVPMWQTPDGFVRYGINHTVNPWTGYFEGWYHNPAQDGEYVNNYYTVYLNAIDNVVLGTSGRAYVVSVPLGKAFVWDYNTNDFTITVPLSGISDNNFYRNHCYFEGKYLIVIDSVMYEFVEHFDEQTGEVTSVSFEAVSTPYFPLTTPNNTTVSIPHVHQLQTITVYVEISTSTAYQLVNGVWTVIEGFTFDEVPGSPTGTGCAYGNYLFGYGYSSSMSGMIPFFNFGPKQEYYGWDQKLEGKLDGLDSRISILEANYGDALNTTNNILGY